LAQERANSDGGIIGHFVKQTPAKMPNQSLLLTRWIRFLAQSGLN